MDRGRKCRVAWLMPGDKQLEPRSPPCSRWSPGWSIFEIEFLRCAHCPQAPARVHTRSLGTDVWMPHDFPPPCCTLNPSFHPCLLPSQVPVARAQCTKVAAMVRPE